MAAHPTSPAGGGWGAVGTNGAPCVAWDWRFVRGAAANGTLTFMAVIEDAGQLGIVMWALTRVDEGTGTAEWPPGPLPPLSPPSAAPACYPRLHAAPVSLERFNTQLVRGIFDFLFGTP